MKTIILTGGNKGLIDIRDLPTLGVTVPNRTDQHTAQKDSFITVPQCWEGIPITVHPWTNDSMQSVRKAIDLAQDKHIQDIKALVSGDVPLPTQDYRLPEDLELHEHVVYYDYNKKPGRVPNTSNSVRHLLGMLDYPGLINPVFKNEAHNPLIKNNIGKESYFREMLTELKEITQNHSMHWQHWIEPVAWTEDMAKLLNNTIGHPPMTPREKKFVKIVDDAIAAIQAVCNLSLKTFRMYTIPMDINRVHYAEMYGISPKAKTFEYGPEPERAVGHRLNVWLSPLQRIIHSLAVGNYRFANNRRVMLTNARRAGKEMMRANYRRYLDYLEDVPHAWWPVLDGTPGGSQFYIKHHMTVGNQHVD